MDLSTLGQQSLADYEKLAQSYRDAGYIPGQDVGSITWNSWNPRGILGGILDQGQPEGYWQLADNLALQYARTPQEEGWTTDAQGNQVWGNLPRTGPEYMYSTYDPSQNESFWGGTLRGFMPIAAVLAPAVGGALLGAGAGAAGTAGTETLGTGLTYGGATAGGMATEGALGSGITGSLATAGSGLSSAGLGSGITGSLSTTLGSGLASSFAGSGLYNTGLTTGNPAIDQTLTSGVKMDDFFGGTTYDPVYSSTGSFDTGYDLGGSSYSSGFGGSAVDTNTLPGFYQDPYGASSELGGLGSGYSGIDYSSPELSNFISSGGTVDSQGFAWDRLGNMIGKASEIFQGVAGAYSGLQQANLIKDYQGRLHDLITNPSSFQASPAAQAQLRIGSENLARSEAARGYLGSGNILGELQSYGQDIASKDYYRQAEMLAGLGGYHAYNAAMGQVGSGIAQASGAGGGGDDTLGAIGKMVGIAGGLASIFSDRRLKKNVKQIGMHKIGVPIYEYDYLWDEHAIGVMADEVEKVMPEAVSMRAGYKTVNYSMLEGV